MLIRHTKLRAFPVYMLSLLHLHFETQFGVLDDGAIPTKSMAAYAEGSRMTAAVSTSEHGVTDCFEIFVWAADERWSTAL